MDTAKDNKRKKYFNLDKMSSDDIYALLDSVESDDEIEIDNLMNDSDTEFIAENNLIEEADDTGNFTAIVTPSANVHIPDTGEKRLMLL